MVSTVTSFSAVSCVWRVVFLNGFGYRIKDGFANSGYHGADGFEVSSDIDVSTQSHNHGMQMVYLRLPLRPLRWVPLDRGDFLEEILEGWGLDFRCGILFLVRCARNFLPSVR